MSSKPEFVIVPGGWQSPKPWASTTGLLTKAGYVVHAVSLPSVGDPCPKMKSFDPDVQPIRDTVTKLLSSGKDVVMIFHSYSGMPGSEALAPYVSDLEKGVQRKGWGKVRRLVYCSAFVMPEGGSLMAALQNKPLPWFIIDVRTGFPSLLPTSSTPHH